jgi:ribosomal protein S18 acetylase RimI-like enzyme
VNIRRATERDVPALRELYAAFEAELPAAPYFDTDLERELREVDEIVRDELALVAEERGEAVGFALARRRDAVHARLTDLYVVPTARRRGVAAELVREVVSEYKQDGVEHLSLEVMIENDDARAVYARWGFLEYELTLAAPLAHLEERLSVRIGEP